jgi:hypothetical protein
VAAKDLRTDEEIEADWAEADRQLVEYRKTLTREELEREAELLKPRPPRERGRRKKRDAL